MTQHHTEKQKPMDEKAKPQREQQMPGQREQPMPGQREQQTPGQREQQAPDQRGQQTPGQPADKNQPKAPAKAPDPGRGERSDKESIGQPVQLDRERA